MSATLTEENPVLHRAQLESELEILKARLSTVKAENTILRQRHGLPASSETDANNSQLTTADGSDTKPSRSNSQPQDRSAVANKRRKLIVEVVLDSTRIDEFRQETLSRKRSKAPTAGIIPRDAQGDVRIKVEPEEWKTIKTEQEIDSLLANLIPDEKKIKIEEDAPRLSRDSIRARLALINYAVWDVSLDERIRNVPVSRAFMTEYYGGNTQDTCPKIKRSRVAIHGLKDFMYLNLELNPYAPKSPGDPGFFFALELKSENMNEVKRVFVRLDRNKWLYVGHYKFVPADPLTIDEWNGQSRAVKRKWSEKCHVKKWGHRARARIFLRRQADGKEPTDEEVEEVLSRESDKHHRIDVSVEEITQALDEGRERIEVWCMKCVGYAEGFQEYIARESATWIAPPPKRKPAQIGRPRAARSPRKAKTGQKRRREDSEERSLAPESEREAGESESEPGNDSDEVQEVFRPTRELRYVPTGTRSRPQSMKIKTEI